MKVLAFFRCNFDPAQSRCKLRDFLLLQLLGLGHLSHRVCARLLISGVFGHSSLLLSHHLK